jgi:DNA-binding FrmR family transcriptional regulator
MNDQTRQDVLHRVRRIAGQVAAVQRMIEQDRYCIDVLNQISAVRSALDALGLEILANHLESCVLESANSSEHPKAKTMKPEELITEVRSVVSRFVR